MMDYKKTDKGIAHLAFGRVNERCLNRNGKFPTYSNIQCKMTWPVFRDWFMAARKQFLVQYPGQRLSIDRINSYGHYELGNIQLIPHALNSAKGKGKPETVADMVIHIKTLCLSLSISMPELISALGE